VAAVTPSGQPADRWWTLAAPAYDRSVGLVGWHRWQDALVSDIARGSVLEIGCGPAHLAKCLLERGVAYVGLDRNAAMVSRARRAVGGWGHGHARIVRAQVTALPFPDASFDVVVATGVLGLLAVRVRRVVLEEMVRVSRKEVRLLEPVLRADAPPRIARSRVLAFVRERPLSLDELVEAGLVPELWGPARLAGVYSAVRASKR
jgi:ubiquinone/menaquinone biosynthesis C-methylase UbiE